MQALAGTNGASVENIHVELIARDEAARLIGHRELRTLERSGLRVVFTGALEADLKLEESYTWGDLLSDFFYLIPPKAFFVQLGIMGIFAGGIMGLSHLGG